MHRLIGHADATALLRRSLAAERVSHAYLITGPRGVGRRTLALELARALNCLAAVAERPCGQCRPCRLIERGSFPDVRVVRRSPERKMILLRPAATAGPPRGYHDSVEFIQQDAQLRPIDGRKKVYLILNAEELSPDAANRLLKTLEEPTAYVHFVLTASDRRAVLPTIVSRCQEIRLRPVQRSELAPALERTGGVSPEQASHLAALAGGCPGWALAAIRDPAILEVHRTDLRDLRDTLTASRLERLAVARGLVDRWARQPDTVRATLRTWLAWWRDLLLVQLGLEERAAHQEPGEQGLLRAAAARVSPPEARATSARVQQALTDLEANVNARLVLDLLVLRLPRLQTSP